MGTLRKRKDASRGQTFIQCFCPHHPGDPALARLVGPEGHCLSPAISGGLGHGAWREAVVTSA